jgi:NAD(P)-dependent dehydrogenase (short-subunit alcohol dehydrogenase family)
MAGGKQMPIKPRDSRPLRFDGRVAVITGAGRGLGREFALLLARRGAAVVINDIGRSRDADRYGSAEAGTDVARQVAEEIEASGGSAVASTADVSDPAAAESIVTTAVDAFGGIDIIINNAGILPYASLEELTPEQFMATLAVHVGGAFYVSRAAWPHFRRHRYGRIVNVCSSVGIVYGADNYAAYGSAKGGLMGLTRVSAQEGAHHGILVNGLLPHAATRGRASVNTPMHSSAATSDRSAELVAHAAAWLAHDQCSASGEFFAVKSGSMREILVSVAEGFQARRPEEFSLEVIRENWPTIQDRRPAISPADAIEYNDYRQAVFDRVTEGG